VIVGVDILKYDETVKFLVMGCGMRIRVADLKIVAVVDKSRRYYGRQVGI